VLFGIGQGRYWKVEKLCSHNSQMVMPIQFGSFAPLYSVAKLQNRNSVLQDEVKTDSPEIQQPIENNEFGSF